MNVDDLLGDARHRKMPAPAVMRALRIGAGLTQADVAALLEVDRASVARYEAGRRFPRAEVRRRYVELLDRLAAEAFA